jgi:hypothetical protein
MTLAGKVQLSAAPTRIGAWSRDIGIVKSLGLMVMVAPL